MPIDPLEGLIEACAKGDRAAFARLYRLTAPKLYAIALRILHDEVQAQDCLQEAYLSIWNHARDYHAHRGAPMAWMASIVRYRALDSLRRRRHEVPLEAEGMEVEDVVMDPQKVVLRSAEAKVLRDCLEEIKEAQRKSLLLAYFQGLTHVEVAHRMQVPLGTVKSWIRRGLEQIRRCLGG